MRRVFTITLLGFLALVTLMGASSIGNLAAAEQCAESEFLTTCPVADEGSPLRASIPTIEGAWQLMGVGAPGTPTEDPVLVTFSPDGTVIVSSRAIRPGLPGMPYDYMYFSTGHGTWQADEDGTISFTVVHLRSDETGTYHGSTTFAGTVAVGADGQSATVDATYTASNPAGGEQIVIPTSLTGERIVVEDSQVATRNAFLGTGKVGVGVLP